MATSADKEPACTADFDRGPGIYPLRVMKDHDNSQNGNNKFSFRVTSSGPAPSIFGLGDMSVYANAIRGAPPKSSSPKFKYVYTGDVNDTSTWTVYVVGNPIRIVE